MSAAPSALGIGAGITGQVNSNASNTWDSKTSTNQSLAEALDYANRFASSQQAREARDSFLRATSSSSDQNLKGLSEQFGASLAEARTRTLDAARIEDSYQRYSHDLSNSEARDYRLSQNETQDLVNFMHREMEANPVLAASGFAPGKIALTPPQEEVRNVLIEKFMAERIEAMHRDLGLAPDPTIKLPASRTTASIVDWHDGNSAGLAARAPRIAVGPAGRDRPLEARVAGDIDAGHARLQGSGASMRGALLTGHREADGLTAAVGAAHHATLGQTMPIAGNMLALARQHGLAVKPGVRLDGLSPLMAPGIEAVSRAARELGLPHGVVTSGREGRHKHGSLHYEGRALDFRGNTLTIGQGRSLERLVQRQLGTDYQVQFEVFPAQPDRNHLHVEHDPKARPGKASSPTNRLKSE